MGTPGPCLDVTHSHGWYRGLLSWFPVPSSCQELWSIRWALKAHHPVPPPWALPTPAEHTLGPWKISKELQAKALGLTSRRTQHPGTKGCTCPCSQGLSLPSGPLCILSQNKESPSALCGFTPCLTLSHPTSGGWPHMCPQPLLSGLRRPPE